MNPENCRLCDAPSREFGRLPKDPRVFFLCSLCGCVFVGRDGLLDAAQEKGRYLQHRNDPTPEYEAFLSRLAVPLVRVLEPGSRGLDFGCGPVPVLSALLEKKGFAMANYDPFFAPDTSLLDAQYDFVTCSETAEHFHYPLRAFEILDRLLGKGGHLAVMTQMRTNWEGFFDWHYPRDPTHVVFYSPRALRWVANRFGWEPNFLPENVVIFRKPSSSVSAEES